MAKKTCSGVAGLESLTSASSPKAATASRMASRTEIASISGGSPTALLRYTLRTLSLLSNVSTLNSAGTSVIAGILYVVGECESKSPLES